MSTSISSIVFANNLVVVKVVVVDCVGSNAIVDISETSEYMSLYTTIKLTPEVQYLSGDGTENNPYKIKEN